MIDAHRNRARFEGAQSRSALQAGMALLAAAVVAGCAGAPWLLGEPFDDREVIPPTSRAETVADHRRKLEQAVRAGEKVVELAELGELERRGALRAVERKRFGDLLRERARDWVVLKRPIALAGDLRHLVELEPGRARALSVPLRVAERAAGDVWLALGENARAESEYRRAEVLGAGWMVYRFRAAWGASPADLDRDTLEHALAELPERALGPFTAAYLDDGGTEARLLRRAWNAARVYGPPELEARLRPLASTAAPGTPDAVSVTGVATAVSTTSVSTAAPAPAAAAGASPPAGGDRLVDVEGADGTLIGGAPVTVVEPASTDRLYGGASLARVLLPLVEAFPDLTAPGPRAREWADRLIAEDPTSPDSLEVAALIDARAGRLDGAGRKLGDLVFYSSDRARGYERGARVWERVGQGRRACLAWEKSARYGAADDARWCELLACVKRTPGAGDPAATEAFIRLRAPALGCPSAALAGAVRPDLVR